MLISDFLSIASVQSPTRKDQLEAGMRKTTMQNGPKLWAHLLFDAPKGSVLMGGAIVDYLAGVTPKDYDIFHTYHVGEPHVPPWWKKTEAHFNDPNWAEAHQDQYLQGLNANGGKLIGSVYEYLVDGKYRVQLIGVNYADPKQHFHNFDHSLTLGRFSQNGLWIHKIVFESLETETVTYVSKNKDPKTVARSLKRATDKAMTYGWHNPKLHGFQGAFKPNVYKEIYAGVAAPLPKPEAQEIEF
jgi:hypothetical protein